MSEQLTIETFYCGPEEQDYLNRWMFDRISTQLVPRIFEISTGSGEFAELIIEKDIPLHMNNKDAETRNWLKKKYRGNSIVREIHQLDFTSIDPAAPEHSRITERFTTVLSLDLGAPQLETKGAIENMRFLLQEGGLLILTLHSQMALLPGFGYNIDDLRRFDFRHFSRLLSSYELLSADYFEMLATPEITPVVQPGLYALVIARKPLGKQKDEDILQ